MICATLDKRHTETAFTDYTISSASWAKNLAPGQRIKTVRTAQSGTILPLVLSIAAENVLFTQDVIKNKPKLFPNNQNTH